MSEHLGRAVLTGVVLVLCATWAGGCAGTGKGAAGAPKVSVAELGTMNKAFADR